MPWRKFLQIFFFWQKVIGMGVMGGVIILGCIAPQAAVILHSDTFSTNTLDRYTTLGMHYGITRTNADWSISGGKLYGAFGSNGVLALEDAQGNLLATPDHFSIAFSYMPIYPETQGPYNQDHPGIVFDRTSTMARELYLRPHSNQAVASFTTNNQFTYAAINSTSGLALHSSYDLFCEVNYLNLTASITIRPLGGGAIIHSSSFSGTQFTAAFGSVNTKGAFGLGGFDTEGAAFDNLVVMDYAVPEPATFVTLLFSILCIYGLVKGKRSASRAIIH